MKKQKTSMHGFFIGPWGLGSLDLNAVVTVLLSRFRPAVCGCGTVHCIPTMEINAVVWIGVVGEDQLDTAGGDSGGGRRQTLCDSLVLILRNSAGKAALGASGVGLSGEVGVSASWFRNRCL